MKMRPCWSLWLVVLVAILVVNSSVGSTTVGRLVKRDDRKEIFTSDYGTISSIDVDVDADDGFGMSNYHLQFISLDPNSLFLPAILHSHMVFFVHTGSGRLSYSSSLQGGGEMKEVRLTRGDVYSLESGTIFMMQSDLDSQRQRFRINAIFSVSNAEAEQGQSWVGPYSFIHHLFLGFDKGLLQAAFQVSEEVIEEIKSGGRTPPIVHAAGSKDEKRDLIWETETKFVESFLGIKRFGKNAQDEVNKKKKKKTTKTFNFFKEDPDVKNCNGWSTAVTSKDLHALKASNIGVFMVNLTTSAMMGPHWNPSAAEIGVVVEGRGMVQVVCSSNLTRPACKNTRFMVEEGDIFIVPRFHPMAHMSFNNETLVFMGFTTSNTNNHPQFLAGEASVLRALNKRILQVALNVNTTTISKLLGARKGSTILDCVSCAEEELEIDKREEQVRKEEEKKRKEEEERRRQQEEEKRREEQEDEEEKRREEEEEKRREEEEEERRRREEEEKRREEEEEERRQEEKRREEEQRRQKEEEEKRREEEEEEEGEEEQRRQEEEEIRKREEKEQRQQEEEEKQRQQEQEEEQRQQEEEEKRKRGEERKQQEEKERRQQEEEEEVRQEEERKREEEVIRREEEEREEEEERRHREEESRRHEEERKRRQPEETEEEAATREEQERERSHPQET